MNSSNKKPVIACDMDEVVADVYDKFLKIYATTYNRVLKKEDYWGKKIYQIDGAIKLRDVLYDKGFFADLPVMKDSQEVLQELQEKYEIFFVSAAMEFSNSLVDKRNWAQQHFPFIPWKNIVLCGSKRIIRADYMIDDHPRNLVDFDGKGLLYTSSHNIDENRFTRVNNWQEVRDFFKNEE